MSGDSSEFVPPKPNAYDRGHAVVRGVLGAIPYAGAGAIELFQAIFTPPLERRRDAWMQNVGEAILQIQNKQGRTTEELSNDAHFIDIVMNATTIALRNSQQEKWDALRNAIENTTSLASVDESLQHMFLTFVDELTVWHLRILKFLQSPRAWFAAEKREEVEAAYTKNYEKLLGVVFSELRERDAFVAQVARDLHTRGLIRIDNFSTYHAEGLLGERTTDLGNQFLRFISEPAPADK